MSRSSAHVRVLSIDDLPLITRLLTTSEYVYQRFTLDELPSLLEHYPAVGVFNGTSLSSFLLSQTVNASSAWLGGYGVSWTESRSYIKQLDMLLDHLARLLINRGVRYLHYSGNDLQNDWLRDVLLPRGFRPYRLLYAYDKFDFDIPAEGNSLVQLRAAQVADIPALMAIEDACFEDFWRYDTISFADIIATHPYFVVAELENKIIGYQFNALDSDFGYLVRIAVHPSFNGQGIGVRLMAEAIRFFKQARVIRIMLNSQDDNTRAHGLYEWFGFVRISQVGFVLRKDL